jgi:uncharacterized protein with GYD domain
MARYLMLGRYSLEAIKGIKEERTRKVVDTIEKAAGKVNSMYALLGDYDLAFVVDYPDNSSAIKSSVELARLTGISFKTFPAISVDEFDKLIG